MPLPSLALSLALLVAGAALPVLAQTSGGDGGDGIGGDGGAGGTSSATGTGGSGGAGSFHVGGGGGGGAGVTGGGGGTGDGPVGVSAGGSGGASAGASGSNGTAGVTLDAGGGGGGGGAHGAVITTSVTNSGAISGGAGGNGGDSPLGGGGGGGGGAGGYGVVVNGGGLTYTNNGTVTGGNGGGGGSTAGSPAAGGNGGGGGYGVDFTGSGTLVNSGSITGGNGGAGGVGTVGATNGAAGAGGVGIVGADLTVNNSGGTITGGFANAGTGAQAFAIVFTGGTNSLGNSGTIAGGINVQGGSFAPALSTSAIGTPLVFGGPLVFGSGTQYVVRVSPTAADNATASGSATLTGASVQTVFAPGGYVARSYDILHATGGLGGTAFTGVSGNVAGFSESLSYTATDVLLNLTAGLGAGAGLNQNQQNVASAVNNFFNSGGALPPGFVSVFGLTGGNLANTLTLLSGEAATGAQQGAFQLTGQFLGVMLDPFVGGMGGSAGGPGGSARAFAPERAALPDDIALAYAQAMKAPVYKAPSFEQRWTAWAAGYGGTNTTRGDTVVGSHDLTARAGGVAAGLDYHVTRDTVAGFALAGGGTDWALAQGLGGGRSDAFQAGVYGATRSGPAYLAGAFAFANHWMSTDRFAAFGDHLTARFDAQSFGGRLEGGYRLPVSPVGIIPYAAVQAQRFHTPGYSETDLTGGGFGLTFAAQSSTATRAELGSRFDKFMLLDQGAILALRGRLAWAHDWVTNPALLATFQALPGASFIVNGAAPRHDLGLVTFGPEVTWRNGWSLMAKFDGEFASGAQTYAGTARVRFAW